MNISSCSQIKTIEGAGKQVSKQEVPQTELDYTVLARQPRLLLIDNYDSFTFNLYQQIASVGGRPPLVIPNDKLKLSDIQAMDIDGIVISPGPGRPDEVKDFGVCGDVLTQMQLPILGVCLGHQGLAHFHGGNVIHAPHPMHGRTSMVTHDGSALFKSMPTSFSVVRYHALTVDNDLPDCLESIAWTQDNVCMGLRHKQRPFWGIQFHPESICTEYGNELIRNFLDLAGQWWRKQDRRESKTLRPRLATGNSKTDVRTEATSVPMPSTSDAPAWQIRHKELSCYADPENVFVNLFAPKPDAFWLDSSRPEKGVANFSFMGASDGPHAYLVSYCLKTETLTLKNKEGITTSKEGIFDFLKRELKRLKVSAAGLPFDFNGGFAGYFGYELKAECGGRAVHDSLLPDARFVFADRLLAFDQLNGVIHAIALTRSGEESQGDLWLEEIEARLNALPALEPVRYDDQEQAPEIRLKRKHATYLSDIEACQREIKNGETCEVCLTNQLHTDPVERPLDLYRTLRKINPAPYASYLQFEDATILSSSPERFIRIDANGVVTSKPIKGTAARQDDPEKDQQAKADLAANEKDRSENLMIVDLVRNDLGRVCAVDSVHVPKLMDIESFATVHQMVSTVEGRLDKGKDAMDAVWAAFPGGSMTGAPKVRTMEIIDRLETEARGVYSGSIGFMALGGCVDLNIVIRTAVCTASDTAIGIGGAIVTLSDPEDEFKETLLKARSLIDALSLLATGKRAPASIQILGAEHKKGETDKMSKNVNEPFDLDDRESSWQSGMKPYRERIDKLDRLLIRTLAERQGICKEVAGYKSRTGMPMMQPGRIDEVKERCSVIGRKFGVRPEFVHRLYEVIIGESCTLETRIIEDKGVAHEA